MTTWRSPCFLCSSPLKFRRGKKRGRGGVGEEDVFGWDNKWPKQLSIFFKYLLDERNPSTNVFLKRFIDVTANTLSTAGLPQTEVTANTFAKVEDDTRVERKDVHLCSECEPLVNKVVELHLQLEVIQMQLAEVVKAARNAVRLSSGLGLTKVKEVLQNRQGASEEEFELRQQLKQLVMETDTSTSIPLVYLKRINVMSARGESLEAKLAVKEEPDSDTDWLPLAQPPSSDPDEFPEELVELPKRRRLKQTVRRKVTSGSSRTKKEPKAAPGSAKAIRREIMMKSTKSRKDLLRKQGKANWGKELGRESRLSKTKCSMCPFISHLPFGMEAHLLQKHEKPVEERNYECAECSLGFTTKQYYELHIMRHGISWKCDVCSEPVQGVKMRQHLEAHPEVGTVFACSLCDRPFGILQSYVAHLRFHPAGTIPCPFCSPPQEYKTGTELPQHLYEFHGHSEFLLRCDEPNCTHTFFNPRHLREHKRKHFPAFTCEQCGKSFHDKYIMQKHLNTVHASEARFKCDLCSAGFRYEITLTSHMLRNHPETEAGHRCHICVGKVFVTREAYKNHMWVQHKLGKPLEYPCHLCGKVFSTTQRRRNHVETHSETLNYTCDVCGFATKTKKMFKRHMDRHNPAIMKRHACSYCDKQFSQARFLKEHVRIHTGERPYVCDICGLSFIQSTPLNVHKKTRHPSAMTTVLSS